MVSKSTGAFKSGILKMKTIKNDYKRKKGRKWSHKKTTSTTVKRDESDNEPLGIVRSGCTLDLFCQVYENYS